MNQDFGRRDGEAITLELDAVPPAPAPTGGGPSPFARPRPGSPSISASGRTGSLPAPLLPAAPPPMPSSPMSSSPVPASAVPGAPPAYATFLATQPPPPVSLDARRREARNTSAAGEAKRVVDAGRAQLGAVMRERKKAMGRTRDRGDRTRPTDLAIFGPVTLSRRQALVAAVGAAAAGGLAATALHGGGDDPQLAGASGRTAATSAASASASASAGSTAAGVLGVKVAANLDPEHLLRRVTYAPTDAMRADIAKLGIATWLGLQMTPGRIKDPGGDAVDDLFPRLTWSTTRAHQYRQADGSNFYEFQLELPTHHMGRAIWSNRQLLEVMVDFWSNHLNIPAPADKGSTARHRFDTDVIRRYALGRFEDMLVTSAVHPAMLDYLDNANSTGQEPNENYARELLELHTLGVHGGYTERDIKQAALLLTGWQLSDETGMPQFTSERHYSKPVKVLGVTYANGRGTAGRKSAESYVRALANHPSTARYLARKLAIRFVADDPPQTLVDKLAATYLAGRTAIAPVLREIFGSPEFAESGSLKVRRPYERVVATMRTLGVKTADDPAGLRDLYYMLDSSGHKPLAWPMPNGYPDVATSWQSPAAALDQLNITAAMVHGWYPNKLPLPGPKKILPKPPRNRLAVIDTVGKKMLGRALTTQERNATRTLLSSTKIPSSFGNRTWEQEETVALATTLILSSPTFLTR